MQALLLACYLCLQLTSISDLSESVILKRDTSCDQCLSGLFNDNEILSVFKTQGKSSGEIVASHKLIREVVEQRLAKYESNGAESSQKSKEESESEKRTRLERFLAEENQKVIEAKNNHRKAAGEVEKELTERRRQLREQQAQENREFEDYVKKLRETVKIYENPTMKDINSPFMHVLRNEFRLMAGQYLLSENGRYKATMQESCSLVFTDEFRDGIFVKKVGSPTHYISSPECHMIMQDDGNLVIYSKITNGKGSQVTWSTGTNSRKGPGYYVKLEDSGDLAMYNQNNRQIWTGSKGKLHAHRYDL